MTKAELLFELDSACQQIAALEAELLLLRKSEPVQAAAEVAIEANSASGDYGSTPPEAYFRHLIEGSLQPVFVSQDKVTLFANQAYADLFGYDSPKEMINRDHLDFVAPEDREWMSRFRQGRLRGDKIPTRYQFRSMRGDGAIIWIEGFQQLIEWNGKPALLGTLIDISAHRLAEEQLQNQADQFQQVFEAIPHNMVLKDKNGRHLLVNRAWRDFWNIETEDALGKTVSELQILSTKDKESVEASDREALNSDGHTLWLDQTLTGYGEDPREFHTAKTPLRDSSGNTSGLLVVALDVTEQNQAAEKLRENEERLRAFMSSAGDVFNIFDENLNLMEMSLSSLKKWGGTLEEKLGRHITEIFPGIEQSERLDRYREVLKTGQPIEFDDYLDTPLMGRLFVRRKVFPVGMGLGIVTTDLTDLQRAQQEMAESAERFRAIAEATPHAMFIVRKSDGQWRYANSMAKEMFCLGDQISTVSAEDAYWDPSERQEYLEVMEREGKVAGLERRRKRANGEMFWARISSVPLRFEGEEAFLTSLIDISGQKNAQEELAANRRLLQTIFDSIPVGVYVKDRQRRYVMTNRFYEEKYGVSLEALVGKTAEEIPHWATAEITAAKTEDQEMLERGIAIHIPERRIERPDGTIEWHRLSRVPIRDDEGNVTGLVGIRSDITDLKQAAEELRESRTLLQTVFDTLPVGVFVKDTVGRFLMVNRAYCAHLNITPEQFLSQPPELMWAATEEQRARTRTEDRYVMETDGRLEIPGKPDTVEGKPYWWHVIKSPLHDHSGNVAGIVGSRMDITDRLRIEDQLRQLEKMEAVGKLAGGVAHEFNNILHMILGFTELMISNIPPGDPHLRNLNTIKSASEKGAALVRQLLGYSRKQLLQPRTVDLNDLLGATTHIMMATLGGKVVFELKPAPNLPRVYADPSSIEQILLNLCLNARDAMPDGGRLAIKCKGVNLDDYYCSKHSWARPGGFVCISVTDSGTGIAEDVLPRIFDPFFTTKGPQEGSGLGLSMVHGLMEQQKGCLNVESEPGRGTTFDLYFPITKEDASIGLEAPEKIRSPAAEPPKAPATGSLILAVEDEAGIQQITEHILIGQGYRLLQAYNGEEGLRLFEQYGQEIDLLLLDVILPGMDGMDFYERIIALKPDIPVVFHSGHHLNVKYTNYIADNGMPLLRKPYTATALVQAIQVALVARGLN